MPRQETRYLAGLFYWIVARKPHRRYSCGLPLVGGDEWRQHNHSLVYYSTGNFVVNVTNVVSQSDTRLFSLVFSKLIPLVDNSLATKKLISGSDCNIIDSAVHFNKASP